MGYYRPRTPRIRRQPLYYLVINRKAAEYNEKKISALQKSLSSSGAEINVIDANTARETDALIRRAINSRPEALVACGGDSTVNLVAQHLIRRLPILGIYPLGRFNNIYRSLYGTPDLSYAARLIQSTRYRRIDHGLVSGRFFLGSLGLGLLPEMASYLDKRGIPKLGISWSRAAASAAAAVVPQEISIKIEAFRFDLAPLLLSINLLPYSLGLPLAFPAVDDDGKGEIIFDIGVGKTILSGFIRQIYKKKYLYSDEVRMFRGNRISIAPVNGRRLYFDGEIMELDSNSLEVEIFEKKVRIFEKLKD